MRRWLAVAALLELLDPSGASAQAKRFGVVAIADRNRALDFRILPQSGYSGAPRRSAAMLIHEDLTPNAAVGLGLAKMYPKRRGSGDRAVRSRKPAVTFIMRF